MVRGCIWRGGGLPIGSAWEKLEVPLNKKRWTKGYILGVTKGCRTWRKPGCPEHPLTYLGTQNRPTPCDSLVVTCIFLGEVAEFRLRKFLAHEEVVAEVRSDVRVLEVEERTFRVERRFSSSLDRWNPSWSPVKLVVVMGSPLGSFLWVPKKIMFKS